MNIEKIPHSMKQCIPVINCTLLLNLSTSLNQGRTPFLLKISSMLISIINTKQFQASYTLDFKSSSHLPVEPKLIE
jgi:hypothetical protein